MYLFFWNGSFSPSTIDCLAPCSAFPQHRQTAVTVFQHRTTRCQSVLCRVVLCCVVLCCFVSCCVVLCRVVLCRVVFCVVLCRVVLCRVVLCCVRETSPRVEPFFRPFLLIPPVIFPHVRRSCWIQITVEEDEKGRFARWEYITLVLIVGTLEPISGKSLFLLRSYRLIHNHFPHARLKVVFEQFSVYLCNEQCVITFFRQDHSMCLISSVCTYLHSNAHNSIVRARARTLASVFRVLRESIQLYLTYSLHRAESYLRRQPVFS